MMRFLALIFAPTRLAPYIVTANVSALYLALRHDLFYYRAEDSDMVEATLYDDAPHLIFALALVHYAARESLNWGMRPRHALSSWGKPEDCAIEK